MSELANAGTDASSLLSSGFRGSCYARLYLAQVDHQDLRVVRLGRIGEGEQALPSAVFLDELHVGGGRVPVSSR